MKLSTKIITAVVLVVGTSGAVLAYGKHNHWSMTPEEKIEFIGDRVSKQLELDAQQRQNFDQLAETVAGLIVDAKASRENHLTELQSMLTEPSLDQARAMELVYQKTSMVNEKAPEVIASLAIFLDSLSQEQKQEMGSFLKHRREHRRHGDGH